MLKCHVLLVIQEKMLVLVPPKLSSELELRSTFLGQFWRHSDGIFSRVTRRTVALYPRVIESRGLRLAAILLHATSEKSIFQKCLQILWNIIPDLS